ncbi:MAG: choice-of-anchor J domain-containing protein [bacterium]|nr:choice-of-anchor J domain-containing protein [bacterium]
MNKLLTIAALLLLVAFAFAAKGPINIPAADLVMDPTGGLSPTLPGNELDMPQPDSLLYDDLVNAGSYRWSGGSSRWAAVRFTPLSNFEVRSVYARISNSWALSRRVKIYAVAALAGNDSVPDWATVLAETDSIQMPTTTSFWLDTTFTTPFTRSAYQDFWIIIGPLNEGTPTVNGTGPWFLFDTNADNFRRSWTQTPATQWNGAYTYNSGYDWRIRVGGAYAGPFVELATSATWVASTRYFKLNTFGPDTVRSTVTNYGNTATTTFAVNWEARDSNNVLVWSSVYNGTVIGARGGSVTVTAPDLMNLTALGRYTITCVVSAPGEGFLSNNNSYLEQMVYDNTVATEFRYDDGTYDGNQVFTVGNGKAFLYVPNAYPAMCDKIVVYGGGGTANLFLYRNDGTAGAPGTLVYSSPAAVTLNAGRNEFDIPNPFISSGGFWVAFTDAGALQLPIDATQPVACQNQQMRVARSGTSAAWAADYGPDHPVRLVIATPENYAVSVSSSTSNGFVGTDVWHTMTITNTGLNSDTYNLTVSGGVWPAAIYDITRTNVLTQVGPLASGVAQQVAVRVSVPLGAVNGTSDGSSLTATSQTSGTIWASGLATTIAEAPMNLPVVENFESGVFPPARWSVTNPDAATITWASYTGGGNTSAYLYFYNYASLGQLDHLITPPLNFVGATGGQVRFSYSYATYPGSSDTLMIYVSYDNGLTFPDLVYSNGGVGLQNNAATTSNFTPGTWSDITVPLPAGVIGQNDVKLRFTTKNDYGNNLYVDNIIVSVPVAGPSFLASPSPFDFGNGLIGNATAGNLAISNFGGATLNISGVAFTGSFTGATGGFTVGAGATVNYPITWTPTGTGANVGTVVFTHDAAGSPSTINLSGNSIGYVANSGGPDSWGYTFTTDRAVGGPTYVWEDIAGATLISTTGNQDDDSWQVTLPVDFDFQWYGQPATTFWVSSNGFITFQTAQPPTLAGNPASLGTAVPNAYIGVFNDDLIYGDGTTAWGGVYGEMTGTAPNRVFVISWINMDQFDVQLGNYVTFQAALYESSNHIECSYADATFGDTEFDYGASATFGIEGWNGTSTLAYSINNMTSAAVGANSVVKYVYPGGMTAPTLSATVSGTELVLNWTAVGTGSYYMLWSSSDPYGGTWSNLLSTFSTTTTFTGLFGGAPVYFKVTALEPSDATGTPRTVGITAVDANSQWRVTRSVTSKK